MQSLVAFPAGTPPRRPRRDAGVYAVVRFTLSSQEDGTRFIVDHAGVPLEWHDHISTGYLNFLKQPLERYFAA